MYVDYILSHGSTLPDVVTDWNLLEEFERLQKLEQYSDTQSGSVSAPIQTVQVFSSLSNQSLKIIDDMLIRGVPLPDVLTNASLEAAMTNGQ